MTYRAKHIFQTILLFLLSTQFIFLGYTKFSGSFCELYALSGMNNEYLLLVGLLEILCAVFIYMTFSRILAGIVLGGITVGYGVASIQLNQPLLFMTVVATFGLLAMVAWLEREKITATEELKNSRQPY